MRAEDEVRAEDDDTEAVREVDGREETVFFSFVFDGRAGVAARVGVLPLLSCLSSSAATRFRLAGGGFGEVLMAGVVTVNGSVESTSISSSVKLVCDGAGSISISGMEPACDGTEGSVARLIALDAGLAWTGVGTSSSLSSSGAAGLD